MANTFNLLSEETFAEKLDTQNALLTVLASQNGGIRIAAWSDVQWVVRMGIASHFFAIGDRLTCNHEYFGKLTWEVIGIDCDTPTDKTKTHSLTLQLSDCLPEKLMFDAEEPTNPDIGRASYGSNNWRDSNIRQWLNSSGEAGEWWSAQTEYDSAPNYAKRLAGFLCGMDEDFVSVVGEVEKLTLHNRINEDGALHAITERFFLLSLSEVYGEAVGRLSEGGAYPYYAENSDLAAAGVDADSNRIKYRNGTAEQWVLRTPMPVRTEFSYRIGSSGEVTNGNADYAVGIAPVCCIV